jgi:hypothetical protein
MIWLEFYNFKFKTSKLSMAEYSQGSQYGDNLVDLNEFLEYYTYVSALYDSDAEFDRMISNTWNLNSNMNPAAIPYAGIPKRVTQVNTKERWLNDHHRAIIGGTEYDPINPHPTSYKLPYKPTTIRHDPAMMRPAGVETLPEYQMPYHEDEAAHEIRQHNYVPKKTSQYEEHKGYGATPKPFAYSKGDPYAAAPKGRSYESPQKPMETNYPDHSHYEVASNHSGYSHHSERSHASQQSHHSSHHGSKYSTSHVVQAPFHTTSDDAPARSGRAVGYAAPHAGQAPNFYKPKQMASPPVHKNSRYY